MYQFFVEPQQIHVVDKSVTITGNDVNQGVKKASW